MLPTFELLYPTGNLWPIISTFLAFLALNLVVAHPFINLLTRLKFYKTTQTQGVDTSHRNPLWYNHLGNTLGVPSSYGLLLIPNIVFLALLLATLGKLDFHTITLLLFFGIFLALGLWDDILKYFYYLTTNSWGLRMYQKLILQLNVFFFAATILYPVHIIWLLVGSVVGVFVLNAYNITDGLDGLIGSLTLIVLPALMYFEYTSFGFSVLFYLHTVLLAYFGVFTFFNLKPAKVTFGDSGTMGVGFLLGLGVFRYPILPICILYMTLLVEGLSSLCQIMSIKYLGKKLFLIAPLHLHLLNRGWEDTKVVKFATIAQILLSLISILVVKYLGWKIV
ncbi:hypothetical protein HYV31_03150 [candidate division WWE3 bacterium]|nr:hypothetical protein [candidate division WWE3 bacterium]